MTLHTTASAKAGKICPVTTRSHDFSPNSHHRSHKYPFARLCFSIFFIAVCALFTGNPAKASIEGKIFPFISYSRITAAPSTTTMDKETVGRGADLFGLISYNDWRVLGEILVDNTEGDLERLQFGRWVTDNTLLWMGRYHTPTAYWDMVYHHSPYLQTSITRPEIMEYEDDGGILPTHIWGFLADHTITHGNREWQFEVGLGAAPKVTQTGLEPIEALDPKSPGNRLAVELLASYMPNIFSMDEIGVFASAMELPSDRPDVDHVRQTQGGAYVSWTLGKFRTISSLFAIHSDVNRPSGTTDSNNFYTGYMHLEYQINSAWRPYARYEGSIGTGDDPYLNLFSTGLSNTRIVGGVRYDFTSHQAATLEVIRTEGQNNLHYNQFMLQWSAMFP
jgi:hypothetical protein